MMKKVSEILEEVITEDVEVAPTYCWSLDGYQFYGSHATREEALANAVLNHGDGDTVQAWVGQVDSDYVGKLDMDELLDRIDEWVTADICSGPYHLQEDHPQWSDRQKAKLFIKAVLEDCMDFGGFMVTDIQTCTKEGIVWTVGVASGGDQ